MRSGELTVEGDIQVVQQLVGLDLASDPAEWLAPYIGDIAACGITQALERRLLLKAGFMRRQQDMAEALTEEWRLAPGPLEVVWFNEEVMHSPAARKRCLPAWTSWRASDDPSELRRLYFIVPRFFSYGLDELIPKMRLTPPLRFAAGCCSDAESAQGQAAG